MFELKRKEFANLKFAIKGETIAADENGVIKVSSKEDCDVLEKTGFVLMGGSASKSKPKDEEDKVNVYVDTGKPVSYEEPAPEEKKESIFKKPKWARKGE